MKKFIGCIIGAVAAISFCAAPYKNGVSRAFAASNGELQNENFSVGFENDWTVEGDYESDYGESLVNSLYFNAAGVNEANGDKVSSAVYYTSALSGELNVEFSVALKSGAIGVIFGAEGTTAIGNATLSFGVESVSYAETTTPYGFDITGAVAKITVNVKAAGTTVSVSAGENTKDGITFELTSGVTEGYFGFLFDQAKSAEGNLLDVSVSNANGNVVYETFNTEKTLATVGGSTDGYLWTPVGTGVDARVLRIVTGNEMTIVGGVWPSEFAYTGYKLTGGIGAEYEISYDLTQLSGGWIGYIFKTNTVTPGVRTINTNTVCASSALVGFVKGDLDVVDFGDASKIELNDGTSYAYGRKMHVTMSMKQIGKEETDLTVSYFYANDLTETVHSANYTVNYPIGGYFAFTLGDGVDLIFSNLRIADGSGKLLGGDNFSTNNSQAELAKNWFVGLSENANGKNKLFINDYGTYENTALTANEKTGAISLISKYTTPERQEGVDHRPVMYEATLSVTASALAEGNFTFLTGLTEETENKIVFGKDKITAYKDGEPVENGSVDYSFPETETEVKFLAKASGVLEVYVGETLVLSANYGDETAFIGGYGLTADPATSSAFSVTFNNFYVELYGIPQDPILWIAKPLYFTVGEEIDLNPMVMADPSDDDSNLELTITVTDEAGENVAVTGTKVTLPSTGYYTISYKLLNKSTTLYTEDSFTARGVYRGTADNTADKIVTNFNEASADWTTDGTGADKQVKSKYDFIYFLADLKVSNVVDSFEITFGECHDYENAFGIVIASDNTVTLRNLVSKSGTDTAKLARELDFKSSTVYLRLTVIGDTVTLQGRMENDPEKYYDLAEFYFEADMPATYGKIGVLGQVTLKEARIYTLGPSIDIGPDNYDPADDVSSRQKKPLPPKSKCSSVLCSPCALIVAGVGAAGVLLKKRNSKKTKVNSEGDEEK